ncbi:MAG: hypothetical protein JW885_02905 [Deltaproteobacteria bacterium]|nr:hypothetical protein [Candidatus Zymogenaceae bacterium]
MSDRDIKVDVDNTAANKVLEEKTNELKAILEKHVQEKEKEQVAFMSDELIKRMQLNEKKAHPYCPLCGWHNTRVVERRIHCDDCDHEFILKEEAPDERTMEKGV